MPTYEITSPNGQVFEVTAPDGATQDQILSYAQQNFQGTETAEEQSYLSKIGERLNERADQLAEITNAYNSGEQGLARSALQAFGNVGLGGLSDIANETVSALTPQPVQDALASALNTGLNSPLAQYGGDMIQPAYDQYNQFVEKNPSIGRDINAIGNIANVASLAIPASRGVNITSESVPAVGSIARSAKNAISSAPTRALNAVLPELDETSALLAKRAEELNIPLYLDQVADSPALNNIQKLGQELPFSGIEKRNAAQNEALNKVITQSFGQDSTAITQNVVKDAYKDLGGQFNRLFKGRTLQFRPDDIAALDSLYLDADVGKDARDIIERNVRKIKQDISTDGTMSGEKFSTIRNQLQEVLRKKSGDQSLRAAQEYIGNALDNSLDVAFRGLTPAEVENYANLKYQYKNLITVTPLAAKATRGSINPQLLENRVSRVFGEKAYANGDAGVLGDVAKISKTFLPKLGGSDTVPKSLYAAGLLGVGATAATGGIPALSALGLTIPANRAYQSLISNPNVVKGYVDSALSRVNQIPQETLLRLE